MSENKPIGEERKIKFIGGTLIDEAPISYIIVLASVVVALSFFPMSAIIAIGGSFPMSQGVYGLVGWILGPIAGAISAGIGSLIGIFLAPHTAGVPFIRILGAVIAAFAAGTMTSKGKRTSWWIPIWIYALISFAYFIGRAIIMNGVGIIPAFAATFIDWSALLLFVLPTRKLIGRWIGMSEWKYNVLGVALGTWTVAGLSHLCAGAILYHMYNWPEEVWFTLIPIVPIENFLRAVIGVIIGSGVIAGLRAIGLTKPKHAIY